MPSDVESLADSVARHAELTLLGLALALTVAVVLASRVSRALGPRLVSTFEAMTGRWAAAARLFGLYEVVCFVVALAALGVFFEVADELEVDEGLAQFDVALAAALAREVGDGTLRTFAVVTRLGDTAVLSALVAAVAVLLLRRRERLLTWSFVLTTVGGMLLNAALKRLFERPRPAHDHGFATADGLSFPSGHAAGSMVVYGFLCYLLVPRVRPGGRLPLVITWLLLAVAVGWSRVLLQVHYFSDVLAGWAVALCWLALSVAGVEGLRRRSP